MIKINFEKGEGLVPAIAQDCATNEVLMMAYMNRESFERTLETGTATYWSRSRKTLWMKGESSGNVQVVKEIFLDCDNDTLLLRVEQIGGAACHTGYKTCFHKKVEKTGITIVGEKIFNPEDVYR